MNTIILPDPATITYPMLMINSDANTVVMFTDHGEGVVIACSSGTYSAGNCCNQWAMSRFSPFTGSITIQAVNGK